jgi:hypothetical protein
MSMKNDELLRAENFQIRQFDANRVSIKVPDMWNLFIFSVREVKNECAFLQIFCFTIRKAESILFGAKSKI